VSTAKWFPSLRINTVLLFRKIIMIIIRHLCLDKNKNQWSQQGLSRQLNQPSPYSSINVRNFNLSLLDLFQNKLFASVLWSMYSGICQPIKHYNPCVCVCDMFLSIFLPFSVNHFLWLFEFITYSRHQKLLGRHHHTLLSFFYFFLNIIFFINMGVRKLELITYRK
jgi:hypothetical protein